MVGYISPFIVCPDSISSDTPFLMTSSFRWWISLLTWLLLHPQESQSEILHSDDERSSFLKKLIWVAFIFGYRKMSVICVQALIEFLEKSTDIRLTIERKFLTLLKSIMMWVIFCFTRRLLLNCDKKSCWRGNKVMLFQTKCDLRGNEKKTEKWLPYMITIYDCCLKWRKE
jgi:hypothetical protein